MAAKFIVIFIIILISFLTICYSAVPLNRYEALMKNEDNSGLYNQSDRVKSLSSENLRPLVLGQKYATLLEFYNSFCGHCRRYASTYKQIANETWPWRNIIKVMAIDCANDKNNDICREYEIMAYPTLRYFSPNQQNSTHIGLNIRPQPTEQIKNTLLTLLSNETHINDWPDFSNLTDPDKEKFFHDLPDTVQIGILIYEPINSTLGIQLILDFYENKNIHIKRTTINEVALSYHIETYNTIATIDHKTNNIEKIFVANVSPDIFKNKIKEILEHKNININSMEKLTENNSSSREIINNTYYNEPFQKPNHAILKEIKEHPKHTVYQADLEHALRYTIYHEIPKIPQINGERLLALQRYFNILNRYSPLGGNGRKFLKKLQEYVNENNQEIRGENFERQLAIIEKEYSPIFSSSRWIGCTASKAGLRGFTCGLWQLFHFMTVQAAEKEISTDPLEVLQAMHGYVKYFFGCSDCSNHFQTMANNRKIWNTSSKDNAILWLWSSHNEVNKRLANDETEDPKFPKIQFPSKESCIKCYRDHHQQQQSTVSITNINEITWDKQYVLEFLKQIHNPQNISRFGIDDETVLPPTLSQLRQKRHLSSVFSDMDMRMGILLYGFCIIMMLFAVKLFLHRGYRKKTYSHDFLGKV